MIPAKYTKQLGWAIAGTALMAGAWRSVSRRQTQIAAAWKRHLTGRYGFDLTPFVDFVRTRFSPRSYLGLHLTVGLIAVTALAWLFGGIVDAISDQGPLGGLDRTPGQPHHGSAVPDGGVPRLLGGHRVAGQALADLGLAEAGRAETGSADLRNSSGPR